jgi:ribonucleoside-diphosphate reductase
MKVTKRDGRLVDFNSDSIRKQTKLACEGFPVDPGELEMSAGIMFKDGMRTDAIQKALINAARMKVTIDRPYFTYIAARLMLYDLYHTIERYYNVEGSGDVYAKVSILDYINKNKDIIGDFVNKYTEAELIELNKEIDGTRDLLFDYAGTKTMILRYIMKRSNIPVSIRNINKDNLEDSLRVSEDAISKLTYDESGKPIFENTPIELPQHMHMLVAMFMAQNEKDKLYWVKKYYYYLSTLKIIAATPINSNSRAKNGSTASCLVVNSDDSIDGIADTYKEIMLGSSAGAGFGRYLGHVRSMGSRIQDRINASSGKIPNCKVANDITEYIDQRGNRKGALTDTIESWDIDVFDYIDLRKKEGDERGRAQNLFLALSYTDEFMMRLKQYREALKAGDKDPEIYWTLFDPYDVQDLPALYGEAFSKRYREYEEMFKQHPYFFNLNTKTIKISLLAKKIAKSCLEEGMPFSFFKCTTNNMHKHKELGTIYSSNLCVSGDTIILTKDYGNKPIKELVESGIIETECWNGNKWSLTTLAKTSDSSKLLTVKLSNGSIINATEYHKWYIDIDGNEVEVRTVDLQPNTKIYKYYDNEGDVYDNIRVSAIEDNNIVEATYCGNEPSRHRLMFNGVLTGNCMEFMNPTNFDEVSVCNLGSLNVARLLNDEELKEASELGLRMLDSVIDATEYSSEKAGKTQKTRRSCGLGVLGMGERLANEGIYQTSKEHFQFEENLLSKISHWVDEYNKELAKEKGSCIIDGYRNAYTMCIAPNSTSGIFAGTTNGIEPVFGKEWKEDSKIGVVTMTAPNISINNIAYYQDGFELDQFKLIEIEGIRQKYIDMGISHNIFLDVNKFPNYQIPGSLIIDLIIHAWECKLKSTYYFRSTQQNNDGVLKHSNQISCVGCAN